MQHDKATMKVTASSKLRLFAITSAVVMAILTLPVIIPHITHPYMIYHIVLHIASVIIATFLSIISILSYGRTGSLRILLMTFGFLSLAIVEFLYLLNATKYIGELIIPSVDIELPHIILFAMLSLFGIGVLKVNK
jgi:hypothetical protein